MELRVGLLSFKDIVKTNNLIIEDKKVKLNVLEVELL